MSLLHVNTPIPGTSELQLVGPFLQPYTWPGGEYYCDASGGENTSFPLIRRCGFGIVLMRTDFDAHRLDNATCFTDVIQFGAFGVLPEHRQTIPRAELYAILEVVLNLQSFVTVMITSDSKVNVDLYLKGERSARDSMNGDLWDSIFLQIREKQLQLSLRWSKGHPEVEGNVEKYMISAKDATGNMLADSLANRAAQLHMVYNEDAFSVKWHMDLVDRIQKRAIVILSATANRAQDQRRPKEDKVTSIPLGGCVVASAHQFTRVGKVLHCFKCHKASPKGLSAIKQWLATECQPNRILNATYTAGTIRPSRIPPGQDIQIGNAFIHSTHQIMVYRGLHFCKVCACYASKRLLSLAVACEPPKGPQDAERRRKAVLALLQGKLPRGVPASPNSVENLINFEMDYPTEQ